MKDKIKTTIITIIVIIILITPIIIKNIRLNKIDETTIEEYKTNFENNKYSLIYYGNINSKNYQKIKDVLVEIKNEYPELIINTIDSSKLSIEEEELLLEISEDLIEDKKYIISGEGKVKLILPSNTKSIDISKQINKYLNNIIPKEEISYKTFETFDEFKILTASSSTKMYVFGRNSCSWCNKFKPVYNQAALDFGADIYYIDSDSFNQNEFNKILNSSITIPAKCTKANKVQKLSEGYQTPLTLFISKGKTVDCLLGYIEYETLLEKLEDNKMLKREAK